MTERLPGFTYRTWDALTSPTTRCACGASPARFALFGHVMCARCFDVATSRATAPDPTRDDGSHVAPIPVDPDAS